MMVIRKLVKRNILNYLYDKSNVFFSFLSVLILVFIYAVFLGKMQVDNIIADVGDIPGVNVLVTSWLIAGLMTVSSFTIPISIMSDIVVDLEHRVFDDFLTAPIKRWHIIVGYIVSAFIVGYIMVLLTFLLGYVYMLIQGGSLLPFTTILKLLGTTFVSVFTFSALSFLLLTFTKTVNAVGVLNTLVGTMIGFFGGIYLPFGIFSDTMQNILGLNPAAQMASAFRMILMEDSLEEVFQGAPEELVSGYRLFNGVDLELFGHLFRYHELLLYTLLFGVLCFLLSSLRLNHFKR